MIIYAPNPAPLPYALPSLFLAGSIEMGQADDWQARASLALDPFFTVFNPRRIDWDDSWEQSKENPQFRQQVEWELENQEHAEYILMYLDPSTKSPVSLLELGLFFPTVVVCPLGFWRKGNVDLVCEKFGIKQADTLEDAITFIKEKANVVME